MEHRIESIKILPACVAEKIAAGEVIERPASVVKELVENSLDAAATRIDISLENAGYSLIRITDNGKGMAFSDLGRSIQRHATSKISSLEDLFSIRTMGFRGEALASVAAVSRLDIVSSDAETGLGSSLVVEGGEIVSHIQSPRVRGTTITVRDLFYNTPARKKFMKSMRGERLHIGTLVEQLSVPFPGVHMSLSVDGASVVDIAPVSEPRLRIGQIAGTEFAKNLVECRGTVDGMSFAIFIGRPEVATVRPRYQSLFVNCRKIDNDTVTYAIRNAFRQVSPGPFNPCFFAFMEVDPGRIDVNVHPTKALVKFDDEKRLFGGIYHIIQKELRSALYPMTDSDALNLRQIEQDSIVPSPSVALSPAQQSVEGLPMSLWSPQVQTTVSLNESASSAYSAFQPTINQPLEKKLEETKNSTVQLSGIEHPEEQWDLISCYQVHDLFIIAPIKNGILLIDQHAAHERILYEQALRSINGERPESQQLLFPVLIELSSTEKSIVSENVGYFRSFGFEIEGFSGNTISISAVPSVIRSQRTAEAVHEMIEFLLDERGGTFFSEPNHRFAAAFACGSAIKAGQRLTQEEMNALLNTLFATRNPYTCPHGRPTIIRMSIDELRRRFMR